MENTQEKQIEVTKSRSTVYIKNGSTYVEVHLQDGTIFRVPCVVFPEKKTTNLLATKEVVEN